MSLNYFKRLLEIANKYTLIIDGEKITLFSLKSRKEITDLIYALHEDGVFTMLKKKLEKIFLSSYMRTLVLIHYY